MATHQELVGFGVLESTKADELAKVEELEGRGLDPDPFLRLNVGLSLQRHEHRVALPLRESFCFEQSVGGLPAHPRAG